MPGQYINRGDKPTKAGFGKDCWRQACETGVVCIGADITSSVGCNLFAEALPGRFISLGVAEQNCIGVATGLALEGKIPVFQLWRVRCSQGH